MNLLVHERELWAEGCQYIAGVDEVGRGCLAGPVVAAAVVLPRDCGLVGVRDSKQLSPGAREAADRCIRACAVALAIAAVGAEEIDRVNIRAASLQAMGLAIRGLVPAPEFVLVDGRDSVPGLLVNQRAIVGGDALSLSIAAASIIAKVYRDRLMHSLEREYPHFTFGTHKGYPTPTHQLELQTHGPTPLHRRSFGPVQAMMSSVFNGCVKEGNHQSPPLQKGD